MKKDKLRDFAINTLIVQMKVLSKSLLAMADSLKLMLREGEYND